MFIILIQKVCRICVCASLILLLSVTNSLGQNEYWSSTSNIPAQGTPQKLVYQPGKGIWGVGGSGLFFFDTKSQKTKIYHTDDSGRVVNGLFDMAIARDTIYALSSRELYKLSPAGTLQRVPVLRREDFLQVWQGIWSNGEVITMGNTSYLLQIDKGKVIERITRYFSSGRLTRKQSKPNANGFLLADFGKGYVLNSSLYDGLYVYDKQKKTEKSITNDNAVSWLYQKDVGLWILGERNLILLTRDSINPWILPFQKDGDPNKLLVQDAKGKLYIHTNKAVYSVIYQPLRLAGDDQILKVELASNRTSVGTWHKKQPIASVGDDEYYYAETNAIYHLKGTVNKMVSENPVPAASLAKSNVWFPDGYLYSMSSTSSTWFQYNGKQGVKKIEDVGYGQGFFTDGKRMYVAKGKTIYQRDAKGGEKKMFEMPADGPWSAFATPDGSIYLASREGVGIYKNGKLDFTRLRDIKNVPVQAIQSIAVTTNNEFFFFFSQPYLYNPAIKEMKYTRSGVNGSNLIFRSYTDGNGGLYSLGIGDGLYYDGTTWFDLKNIIRLENKLSANDYVSIKSLAVDYKGRCWMICSFKGDSYMVLLDKGKVVETFTKDVIPQIIDSGINVYCKDKELMFLSSNLGITIYKLK